MHKQLFCPAKRYFCMKVALIVVFSLLLTSFFANGQDTWELRRDENGIKIYSRRANGGKLVELRLLTQFNTTPDELLNTLLNIQNYSNWIYGSKRAGIIKKINDHDIIYFTEAHLPWPIQDRDLVTELTVTPATATAPLIIQAKSVQGILPPKPHFIRVPYSLATWRITPEGTSKVNIDYTFSVDPGGSVPGWLVNMTIAGGPYKSFVKLADMLQAGHSKKNL
jgi:hypothetical protein